MHVVDLLANVDHHQALVELLAGGAVSVALAQVPEIKGKIELVYA